MMNIFTPAIALGLMVILLPGNVLSAGYSLRRHAHVKAFYQSITQSAVDLGMKHNVPPAAILAMAGHESGYGRGYVARITGNILSLGAHSGEAELPALNLPTYIPDGRVLIDKQKIEATPDQDLEWKQRPPSLKKDYRPNAFASTKQRLAYLQRHPDERMAARRKNISDFVSNWISTESTVPVFVETRAWLDQLVQDEGKDALLSCDNARLFISHIGGKPHSFNPREAWVGKVDYVLDRAGLCPLTIAMSKGMSFDEAWNASPLSDEGSRPILDVIRDWWKDIWGSFWK